MADFDDYLIPEHEFIDENTYAKTQANFNSNTQPAHLKHRDFEDKRNRIKIFSTHYKEKLSHVKENIENSVFYFIIK